MSDTDRSTAGPVSGVDRDQPPVSHTEIDTPEGSFTADVMGPLDGSCVILLHGFPQSNYTWRNVIPALAREKFRAVAPDQRGYSVGVRPAAVSSYRIDRLVEDVTDLADSLGCEHFHLVGHDWGGQVAWMIAAKKARRVLSLSVLSRPHPAAFAQAMRSDPEQPGRSRHHKRFLDPEMTDVLWLDGCARLRAGLEQDRVPQEDIDAYLSVFDDRMALDAALNWYRATGLGGLAAHHCPKVTVPTLYLWGDQDSTVGRVGAELTGQHVTGPYRFVEISGSGHFLTDDGGEATVIDELLAHLHRSRPKEA